jgi:hypothetical protein
VREFSFWHNSLKEFGAGLKWRMAVHFQLALLWLCCGSCLSGQLVDYNAVVSNGVHRLLFSCPCIWHLKSAI